MPTTQNKPRPSKGAAAGPMKTISVRLAPDLLAQVEAAAAGSSLTDFVRELLIDRVASPRAALPAPEICDSALLAEISNLAASVGHVEHFVRKAAETQSAEMDRLRKQLQLQSLLLSLLAKPLGLEAHPSFRTLDKQIQAMGAGSKKGVAA